MFCTVVSVFSRFNVFGALLGTILVLLNVWLILESSNEDASSELLWLKLFFHNIYIIHMVLSFVFVGGCNEGWIRHSRLTIKTLILNNKTRS